ncbi:extracellular matrix protein 3-like [Ptychodera flava]|uniref:extracellular matrix protein 3-like n=1 Tax=Ptychodera flava TaxID=63121 RepID=UPI00396A0299
MAPRTQCWHICWKVLAAFCVLVNVSIAQLDSVESRIIVRNTGIAVPFGREKIIDPVSELSIAVEPGDRCVVTVLENDPLSQWPGRISPNIFPCDFEYGLVKYSHFGSRKPQQDRVKFQLRYDTPTDTFIIPFMIDVRVESKQLEIVTKNIPLNVQRLMGQSDPVDQSNLEFTYNRATEQCKVTILSPESGFPKYGLVVNIAANTGIMMDCDDFLEAGIRYQHTAATDSPREDYIPMVVELLDQNGNKLKQEYFQKLIKIIEGQENMPPTKSFTALLIMEVDQFVMTAITSDILAAEDLETDPDKLIFNITTPLGPGEGYIVSTDDRNQPITSFYQKDIRDLKIAYVPPSQDSAVKRYFEIELEVVDSELATSEPFILTILVKPMNTLAPVATRNTGMMLFEGQSRPLLSSLNLEISDEDNLEDVRIQVLDGLRHGELLINGRRRKFFTPADLDAGRVVYRHDDSDTYSDNIIFRMTDGENEVEFLFPITIATIDDEPPVVTVNTGLEIDKGEVKPIEPVTLAATDIDSDDATIMFIIEQPYSTEGEIIKRQLEIPPDPQNWRFVDGFYEQPVTEWLQEDIFANKIFYRHIGPHNTQVIVDEFKFRVADSNDPPNVSKVNTFVIKVRPVDDQPPYLYPGTPLAMAVEEFELTEIKKKFLRYTDLDSDDRELKYTITQLPFDNDLNNPLPAGDIVLFEQPDIPVTMFTQAQINHLKIGYKPPTIELGITPRVIAFVFSVQDPAGNVVADQRFTIFLSPVDNKPPVITNTGFTVFERGSMVIAPTMLDATDPDTNLNELTFTITDLPDHGTLNYDSLEMIVGEIFTLEDIQNGRIMYVNSGAEEDDDSFQLDISDGVHIVPITVRITIRPIDDEAPTLELPPDTFGVAIEVLEGGSTLITSKVLSASDPDTDNLMLTFLITAPPQHGAIERNSVPGDRFTQQDIVNGLVRYRHTAGEIGLEKQEDSFFLTLSDMSDEWIVGGNRITAVQVRVTILPVDSIPPNVTIGLPFVVFEADKSTITLFHLNATDADTVDDDITCTVIVPAMEGYIENISPAPGSEKSRTGIPISAFTLKDIRLGHINYVQSIHTGFEPIEDRFTFRCSDGINFSPNYFFPIIIDPTNDEEPTVFTREFIVMEGMDLTIDTPILNAEDKDIPADELHFFITKFPEHGTIVQRRPTGAIPVTNFTLDQIIQGSAIVYEHDDSETLEDTFTIKLTDGIHEVTKEILIMVIPLDDETPRLTINNGLDIEIGESHIITNDILKATDLDSNDPDITFIVRFGPHDGFLQRLDENGRVLQNITVGMNFTQHEIDTNRIRYIHTGREGIRDLIKFDVTDGLNPLIDRYFYVTVDNIDLIFPDVINKGVELPEGGRVTLTTDLLSTTDLNSPDENLLFEITKAPVKGHLESTDNPGVRIESFTQLELAGNKIFYVHTSDDEMKMDSFEFEVTDGFNPVFRTFRIAIGDVDNKKPVVFYEDIVVKEGGNKLITPFELRIDDRDTEDPLLQFTITQIPVHGNILRNYTEVVTVFTMVDLNENLISYQHDGSESTDDSFSFIATDGTHSEFYVFPELGITTRKPQLLNIKIISVDNGVPQIVTNKGATTIGGMGTGNIGFRFTNKILKVEDRDSDNDNLVYTITTPPGHGYLINIAHGNNSISNFTQGDVDNMLIHYVLAEGTNATSDIFFFSVGDKGKNILPNQPFRLNWAWISLDKEYYIVNETDRTLHIKLHRRGYLGETSFVGIKTEDGTAKKGEDFNGKSARQVQFNPGQTEGKWRVKILDDDEYEQMETFSIILHDPVMGALEHPEAAIIEIHDSEDESTVCIDLPERYEIEEDVGELFIPIKRTGDLSNELMVVCSTMPDTATGTSPSPITSYSDYISRAEDQKNFVRFGRDEDLAFCRVVIIDDSLYEDEEQFKVKLSMPMGGRLCETPSVDIVIKPDEDDEPTFYFGSSEYLVDEGEGFVEIRVWRTGTDLSKMASVTVRSRQSDPESAVAGLDYHAVSKNLDFAPGVTMQTVRVTILDDLGQPQLEGPETFEVVLRMAVGAEIGRPDKAIVTINDSVSDLPKMSFRDPTYEGFENDGSITAYIVRSGDISQTSTVRCYTRQGTAQVMMDYDERPNTDASIVTFLPGEQEKPCTVLLMNDNLHEPDESFRLVLGSPGSDSALAASIGLQNETVLTIKDDGDKPIIKFSKTTFTVVEPQSDDDIAIVRIPVIRMGDSSQTSIVRVHTKDGSAKSGIDYNPFSQQLEFGFNVTEHIVEVEVLHDPEGGARESFTVHLKMDENMIAETQMDKAIIYITDTESNADVTFPSLPEVVSLINYDNTENKPDAPIAGYPLVCVTPCNPKYSDYAQTGSLCTSQNINDTLSQFRWRVSAPSSASGVSNPLKDIESDTFFTSTKQITLDSIYFGPGSRIVCVARAVNTKGDLGLELDSPVVTIASNQGLCPPRVEGAVGAEPFTAKLQYTGPDDPDHSNMIQLTITLPHTDGMLPVISTRQLSNFELTLSKDGSRVGIHKCSNLLDTNEVNTRYGFITEETKDPNVVGEVEPYQFNPELRGEKTLRFYKNLNLEACMWVFNGYYDMSELLTDCGGTIGTDGQVLDLIQSYVTVRVPLYVSYIFHSPVAVGGWQHFDLNSQLRLTFVYDTAILWENGIGTPPDATLQGFLYPTSMRINDDGKLVVNFRTEARFRGQFVQSHPGTALTSMVMSPDNGDLTFTLELIRSDPTYAQPEQTWQFVSDYAVRDYSGDYIIKLIPCTTANDIEYSLPIVCNPRDPITFEMPIRFQQVSDPVPAQFSLDTQFHLLSKKGLWLSDGSMGFGEGSDTAYAEGDTIYGRVMVDPVQNLGDSFFVSVEKVFLCTGLDGYVPKYNPQNQEYGCVADSPNLLYNFKVLDKGAPNTVTTEFSSVPFDAVLAVDDQEALPLVQQPGADGFKMSVDPLFEVSAGRQWYLHCIYTVRSADNSNRGIGKRSIEMHNLIAAEAPLQPALQRQRREIEDVKDIGVDDTGTNMHRVRLNFTANSLQSNEVVPDSGGFEVGKNESKKSVPIIPIVAVLSALGLVLLIVILCVVLRRRRSHKETYAPTKPVTKVATNGHMKVVDTARYQSNDNTEV